MRRMIPLGTISLALMLLAATALPAAAEMDEAARAARWADLRHAIFGDLPVKDAGDLMRIEAPDRAQDAALVPVQVDLADRLAKEVRRLYLVVDNNPSPLAGTFAFGPAADPHTLSTRIRVDDYTYIHAVAELADGSLHASQHFIKAAGGCSAPAGKDQAAAMQRLGRMKLLLPGTPQLDRLATAQLLISHPNSSGLQMDQLTRQYIPADFIQQVTVTYGDEEVFTLTTDITLSENPSIRFGFLPKKPGELRATVDDSSQRRFSQAWPVAMATN